MSAFIVAKETIENILNGVEAFGNEAKRAVLGDYSYGAENKYNAQKFGEEMADLNQRAVNLRYKENTATESEKYAVKVLVKNKPNLLKALASLQCLKYQCDEFEYEEPTMRVLDRREVFFLNQVVRLDSDWDKIISENWR